MREISEASNTRIAAGILATIMLSTGVYVLVGPTMQDTSEARVVIPAGARAPEIAEILESHHIIRHAWVFRIASRALGFDDRLQDGFYAFSDPLSVLGVLYRISSGDHGVYEARVTFAEGVTVADMANELATSVPGFSAPAFLAAASTSEGYLFPDTYFILPGTSEEQIVSRLRSTFDEKVGTTSSSTVIIASILEREAKTPEDMRTVSGILANRLKAGMPLQVDATFEYIHGVRGYTPTSADLESSSPYNTYRNKGLPPTPIGNPGLVALAAAANPPRTPYFYYLTGTDGKMHYAKTFAEHKKNRALYLN